LHYGFQPGLQLGEQVIQAKLRQQRLRPGRFSAHIPNPRRPVNLNRGVINAASQRLAAAR
jgi:hypothetical protein